MRLKQLEELAETAQLLHGGAVRANARAHPCDSPPHYGTETTGLVVAGDGGPAKAEPGEAQPASLEHLLGQV